MIDTRPLRNLAASTALGMSLALAAAGQTAVAQTPAPSNDPTLSPDAQQIDPNTTVVAKVGDQSIYLVQLLDMMEELPAQYRQVPFQQLYPALLDRAIDTALVASAARSSDVGEDPAVQRQVRQAENEVLSQAWLNREIGAEVTDEAVRQRYEEFAADQAGAEEIRARHILLETEEAARDTIQDLNDGADFAELAKERSTGPSAVEGGDLGWFGKGQMVPEFEQAAMALEPGSFTEEPVQTQFGWHVILLEDKRSADAPPFEQVQEQLASDMTREKIQETLEELREGQKVLKFNVDGTVPSQTPKAE